MSLLLVLCGCLQAMAAVALPLAPRAAGFAWPASGANLWCSGAWVKRWNSRQGVSIHRPVASGGTPKHWLTPMKFTGAIHIAIAYYAGKVKHARSTLDNSAGFYRHTTC